MTTKQAKKLGLFCYRFAELAAETLMTYAESGERENQVSLSSPVESEKRFMNRQEVAEYLGVSVRIVSDLIKEGLPTVPLGKKRIQFDRQEVLNWTKNREFAERGKTKLRVVS